MNGLAKDLPFDAEDKFKLENFQSFDGEGISAELSQVDNKEDPMIICCGNEKLMKRFKVDMDVNQLKLNIESLEKEG